MCVCVINILKPSIKVKGSISVTQPCTCIKRVLDGITEKYKCLATKEAEAGGKSLKLAWAI